MSDGEIACKIITGDGEIRKTKIGIEHLPTDYQAKMQSGMLYLYSENCKTSKIVTYDDFCKIKNSLLANKTSPAKSILSWIMLCLSYLIFALICNLPATLCYKLINNFSQKASILTMTMKVTAIFLLACITWIAIIFCATATLIVSEKVCKSVTGNRYRNFGVFLLLGGITAATYIAVNQEWKAMSICIVTIIFGIYLTVLSKDYELMQSGISIECVSRK